MKLQLVRKKKETSDVESFVFHPAEPLVWKAGQFFHYVLHHEPTDERGSDRWFTVASAPSEKEVMLTTRFASEKGSSFKAALSALPVGEYIEISDVDGDFVADDPKKEYVFIAGGIGITPMRAILTEAAHAGMALNATLLYANRDSAIPFKGELEQLQKRNPLLAIHYITAPDRIDEIKIRETVANLETADFYVSGPVQMVRSVRELLEKMDVAANRIQQDDFPGYAGN